MFTGYIRSRPICVILIGLLPLCMSPAFGGSDASALTGVILDAGSRAPLAGVQVHVADPVDGSFYVSEPTGTDGTFSVTGLPSATYEIGVERNGGLFLVQNPVSLAPGQNHLVEVILDTEDEEEEDTKGATFWQNPLTAALLVTGSAIVIGLLLEEAVEDNERTSSPHIPAAG